MPQCNCLQASGADISHNPSDANILLINSETDSGLKFVHDWKADPHKIFLKYHWIQACIRAGRALLEGEDWGGFRVFHASRCVYSDEEGDESLEDAQSETRWVTFFALPFLLSCIQKPLNGAATHSERKGDPVNPSI